MATTIALNQTITESPNVLTGGDFGSVIASNLTFADCPVAIVDGDLIVSGTITGGTTGNLTGNVTGNLTGNVTGNTSGTAGSATTITGLAAKSFADDAAAATGLVPVGGMYHTSGAVKVRLA